jgi:voltage-dependent calcium channel alpha-2/delta-3
LVHYRNEFSETNKKAIDEIWYRRAVEQHFIEANSFVYAVPFDAANKNDTLVTATHAVFHKENSKSAPAAVVGFQFQHSAMYTLFRNITGNCADSTCMNCASDDFECFVLDDNGYVIVSPDLSDTGKFFGEVRGFLMHHLVRERVYKSIIIYDYQAVCFIAKDSLNLANRLLTVCGYQI